MPLAAAALLAVACGDARVLCPDGFLLSGDGRCLPVDAGVLPRGDGGPLPIDAGPGDAGSDARVVVDAAMPTIDAAMPVLPDACAWGTWYTDADHDRYGDRSSPVSACSQPAGTVSDSTDCDDTDPTVHQIATFYLDGDHDTYGTTTTTFMACHRPGGYVSSVTPDTADCNDANPAIHPGAMEVCNGIDDDCDGRIDEGVQNTYYLDCDGDGYASMGGMSMQACTTPTVVPGCGSSFSPRWITLAPTSQSTSDCHDFSGYAYPGSLHFDTRPYRRSDSSLSYDWNCDGVETRELSEFGTSNAICSFMPFCRASRESWVGTDPTFVPTCGHSGSVHTCDLACAPTSAGRTQACR